MQTKAQTVLPAARAGIVMSLEGFFGTVFSLILGLAVFRPAMALGGIIVTLSVVLSSALDS
jgi:drug/metabolite transporter (DMT)-like permease